MTTVKSGHWILGLIIPIEYMWLIQNNNCIRPQYHSEIGCFEQFQKQQIINTFLCLQRGRYCAVNKSLHYIKATKINNHLINIGKPCLNFIFPPN